MIVVVRTKKVGQILKHNGQMTEAVPPISGSFGRVIGRDENNTDTSRQAPSMMTVSKINKERNI